MSGVRAHLREAFELLPEAVLLIDESGAIAGMNAPARSLFMPEGEPGHLADCLEGGPGEAEALLQRLKHMSANVPLSLSFIAGDGSIRQLRASGRRLRQPADGIFFMLRILTEEDNKFAALNQKIAELDAEVRRRRVAQTKAEEALELNRLLTLELHHRVNNNLQLQISLLTQSVRRRDNPELRDFVSQAVGRLRAMSAGLHLTHLNGESAGVRLSQLIGMLAGHVRETLPEFQEVIEKVETDHTVETVQVTPLALIINEVTRTALLRAQEEAGTVVLHSWQDETAMWLDIRETGPRAGINETGEEHLALLLVDTLASQAGAGIERFKDDGGAVTRLEFIPRKTASKPGPSVY